jgi:hypothetical protein
MVARSLAFAPIEHAAGRSLNVLQDVYKSDRPELRVGGVDGLLECPAGVCALMFVASPVAATSAPPSTMFR